MNITATYEFLLNGFHTVWNWLSIHSITLGEFHVSFLDIALFLMLVRILVWVFPFFGDDIEDDDD